MAEMRWRHLLPMGELSGNPDCHGGWFSHNCSEIVNLVTIGQVLAAIL